MNKHHVTVRTRFHKRWAKPFADGSGQNQIAVTHHWGPWHNQKGSNP